MKQLIFSITNQLNTETMGQDVYILKNDLIKEIALLIKQ